MFKVLSHLIFCEDHVTFVSGRAEAPTLESVNLSLLSDFGRLPCTSAKINQQHFTIIKPSYILMSEHMDSATSVLLLPSVVVTLEPPAVVVPAESAVPRVGVVVAISLLHNKLVIIKIKKKCL